MNPATTLPEPPTLGPADVAPPAKRAKPPKVEKILNPLYDFLLDSPDREGARVCDAVAIIDTSTVHPTDEQIRAMENLARDDHRFTVFLLGGVPRIKLATPPVEAAPAPDLKTIGDLLAEQPAEPVEPVELVSGVGEPVVAPVAPTEEVISTAPVPAAAEPLTPEELHTRHHEAMIKHIAKSQENARAFYEMKREEASLQGELNALRDRIKEHTKDSYAHDAAVPTLESIAQRTIFEGDVPADTPAAATTEAAPWRYALPPDQTITLEASGLTFDQLVNRIRGELPQQEKLHQVGEDVVEVKGSRYLIRESSEDDRRWFLQPVFTKDEWQQLHEATFGRPVEDFDQNGEAADTRKAGGDDCGRVVKAGRSKAVLGPESHGLVITVAEPPVAVAEPELDARQRAAGEGSESALFE